MEKKYVVLMTILGFAVLFGSAYGVWRYVKLKQEFAALKAQSVNPLDAQRQQVTELVTTVGKLMALPTGELPTVATVDDVSKLKNQPFFADAKKGDRVLLYTAAKKIILYRPSENKIIDVSIVNVGSTSASLVSPSTIPFILWNGTTTVGLTKIYRETLVKKISTATVAGTANAKNDYTATVLVDLTGRKTEEAKSYASTLGITVAEFPKGEIKPTGADFLIVLGADQK